MAVLEAREIDRASMSVLKRVWSWLVDPPRPISELLGFLAGPSANCVTLNKPSGGVGATLELAREMADRLADKWAAEFPEKSMLISRAEYGALKHSGAEDELPDSWDQCE